MVLQNIGNKMALSDIEGEFGGSAPTALSEYYRGGGQVPSGTTAVPETGNAIALSDFYGTSNVIPMTYEIIGGGGGGGGGSYSGAAGATGGTSSFSGAGITTVTATGGAGGAGSGLWGATNGASSYYGSGGQGGLNSDSGNQTMGSSAPSSSYGAGGGGGGSAPFSAYNGGHGGGAAIRQTGTIDASPSSTITVTIGSGGGGGYGGGSGAGGYAKFTVAGQTFTFTSSGTFTVPSV